MSKKVTQEEFEERVGHLPSGVKLLGEYKSSSERILVDTPEGLFKVLPESLYRGFKPNIQMAVDKTAYWVSKAKEKHGDKYDYSLINYKKSTQVGTIICPKHGEFKKKLNQHLKGRGCIECAIEKKKTARLISQEEFEHQVRKNFPEFVVLGKYRGIERRVFVKTKYGYCNPHASSLIRGSRPTILSAVDKTSYFKNVLREENRGYKKGMFKVSGEYKNRRSWLTVTDKYGKYAMLATSLLIGSLPCHENTVCKNTYYTNRFIEVWGNEYSYDKFDYQGYDSHAIITCPFHGDFKQYVNKHLIGIGCPSCRPSMGWSYSSWKEVSEGSSVFESFKVYVVRCWDEETGEEFYKIGKTFRELSERFRYKEFSYSFEKVKIISSKEKYREISEIENILQRYHRKFSYLPKKEFKGMYECFSEIDLDYIKKEFKKLKNK